MADRIEIDFGEAERVATDISTEAQELMSRMNDLNGKIMNDLTAVWKGDAADKFTGHYQDNMQKVLTETAPQALEELSTALNKNVENFRNADAAGSGG